MNALVARFAEPQPRTKFGTRLKALTEPVTCIGGDATLEATCHLDGQRRDHAARFRWRDRRRRRLDPRLTCDAIQITVDAGEPRNGAACRLTERHRRKRQTAPAAKHLELADDAAGLRRLQEVAGQRQGIRALQRRADHATGQRHQVTPVGYRACVPARRNLRLPAVLAVGLDLRVKVEYVLAQSHLHPPVVAQV